MYQFTGFTPKANDVLNDCVALAENAGHTYVGTEHLLWALCAQDTALAGALLNGRGVTPSAVAQAMRQNVGAGVPTLLSQADFTPRLRRLLANALSMAEKTEGGAGTGQLLGALLAEKRCAGILLLEALGASPAALSQELDAGLKNAELLLGGERRGQEKKNGLAALEKYASDLTRSAQSGRVDPVVCRDAEIARVIRILCRRTKNNPCLIGEAGVGKTAVAEGLAARIAAGTVPPVLKNKRVYSLELNSMVAGAKYRGDFEERIKNVLQEVMSSGSVILFIDEIHNIIGAGSAEGAVDAANILKPALARGELRVIGATTAEEYRKFIASDAALERRFQTVMVEEPSPERAAQILRSLRPRYEEFHGCAITDGAVDAAVKLSVRYLWERFLPDKAIDLLDEACARKALAAGVRPEPILRLEAQLEEARREMRLAAGAQDRRLAAAVRERELQLREEIEEETERWEARQPADAGSVTAADVAAVLSEQTGIPADSLQTGEKTRLAGLEEALSEIVTGQAQAVRAVSAAIRRSRTGLSDPDRPIGTFFFCGPTGVGKTALAKAVAECVFRDKKALIRVDMNEYSEPHAVSRLFGAPPGYVGFEEGGFLTERLRRRPYSVLLFDEVEKAHPDVFNALLQLMEDGEVTSAAGRTVNCRNCVVIFTSNAGDRFVSEALPRLGFAAGDGDGEASERVRAELKKTFRPEFLNRLDEIVVFRKLDTADLIRITRRLLAELTDRAAAAGVRFVYAPEVPAFIVSQCDVDAYGARPLRRYITSAVEDPLSVLLLQKAPAAVTAAVGEGKIMLSAEE